MTKEETKVLKVFNPYLDKYEDMVVNLELHFNRKGGLDGVSVAAIISEEGGDLMPFLNPDKIPTEIEETFLKEWQQ